MASGNTVPYVQGQDILLINSVADIQSINFLTEYILGQAAAVMCAMIDGAQDRPPQEKGDRHHRVRRDHPLRPALQGAARGDGV